MKSFIAFAAIVAVATSAVIKPAGSFVSELGAILAAINSPSTDPATAALLEQQLLDIISGGIAVGPAVVDEISPIAVGPAIVDEIAPIDVGPASVDELSPIAVGPAIVDFPVPAPSSPSSPLVQIILNVNAPPGAVAITPEPVTVPEVKPKPEPKPVPQPELPGTPVIVVDEALESIIVAEPIIPEPVEVPQPIVPEPVLVDSPLFPAPAVVLPEILN